MTEHTPLPWAFSPWHIEEGPPAVRAPAGYLVTTTASDADAAYIVKACNAFPDLVKALEAIKQATIDGRVCDDVAWFDEVTTLHDFCDEVISRVKGAPDHG